MTKLDDMLYHHCGEPGCDECEARRLAREEIERLRRRVEALRGAMKRAHDNAEKFQFDGGAIARGGLQTTVAMLYAALAADEEMRCAVASIHATPRSPASPTRWRG